MKTSKIDIEIIFLPDEQNVHLIIPIKLSRKKLRFLIDTGASHSCIANHAIKNILNLETEEVDTLLSFNEEVEDAEKKKLLKIPSLKIGDFFLRNHYFLQMNIEHINLMYEQMGINAIDGICGGDILFKYKSLIDYENKFLMLKR